MKILQPLFIFLFLAFSAIGQPINTLPLAPAALPTNYIFVVENPAVRTYKATISALYNNIRTNLLASGVGTNLSYTTNLFILGSNTVAAGANVTVTTNITASNVTFTVSSTGGSGVTISNANLLFVDKGGNNATAIRGRRDLPYLTLTAAKTAAVAGDTIVVFPGNYEGTNLWKNMVNWHFYSGCLVSNISANPSAVFDNTVNGTQGAITSSITGDAIFLVAHTDLTSPVENGVISVVDSNSVIYVHCRSLYGGPDNPSFYALCLRDGYTTTVECNDIDSVHVPGGINSSVLWHNGEAKLVCNTIATDNGYGIWGNGFKAGNFHVSCRSIRATNYAFVFWEPTHKDNKLWLTVDEAAGEFGGVTLGGLTQLGGKVYFTAQKVSMVQGANSLPIFYLSEAKSESHLWVTAQKVAITNSARWISQIAGTSDFTVAEWADDGNSGPPRNSSWMVAGGTNYVHGGRILSRGGTLFKSDGGMTIFENTIINSSGANQATNYPILMSGGAVTLNDVTLIAPASAFTITGDTNAVGAPTSHNVRLQNTRHNTVMSNNIVGLVGPWTIDANVQ